MKPDNPGVEIEDHMRITITDKYMTEEVVKFLGVPFTSERWRGVYRFVRGGARIERVCFRDGYNTTPTTLTGKRMEQHIQYLMEQLGRVQLVEIEWEDD